MSLYTKYRPKDFENLVGQDFIKETLKKAILEEKTVGAYLFCGPRGTGKTTTARLFAKTINCLDLKDGNPCNQCENCKEFMQDQLIDIIEIDAASHTGVDNIREIIEKAQFSPTKTKYKIYIIDEVHMLSKGAFNALLKILEEPPKHVKFILATTETHKLPETIISRCQRYDFKRIDKENLKKRLIFIANSENVKIDEESLDYIISSSNGGARNAISLFEQLIEDSEVKYEKVVEKLGISKKDKIENFILKLENKDNSIISDFDKIVDSGKNLKLFFKETLFTIKEKILEKIKYGENIGNLINIFDILDETSSKTKNSLDENTTFLIGILKIIGENNLENNKNISENKGNFIDYSKEIKNLTKKIEELEKNISKIKNLKVNLEGEKNDIHTIKDSELNSEGQKIFQNNSENISKNEDNFSLEINDLDNIFGEEENSNQEIEKKQTENSSNNLGNSSFNLENFSKKVKENGGSSALFWGIKGCKFLLGENFLEINPNTKVSRTNVEKSENITIMMKSLQDLGFENFTIKII